jgi:trigger factor
LPEIDISGYQELRAEKPDTSISEDEVNATLDRLREQHATYASVEEDRPLQDGDYAQAELTGNPKEGEGQPVHMDEVLVEVGGANTLPEFSENLRGARVGETKTFDVKYPDDFSDRRLAGKGFTYSLAVKAIKRKQVPELNDDFAREVGTDFQTVEDLRKRIRESMQQEKQHEAEHQAKDKLIEQLVARHEFSVPESLVERQVDLRLERGLRALAAQGMRTEDMKKMDFGRLRAGQREQALREVKSALLLDKIADAEHIEVTDEELNQEIDAIAKQMKQTSEQVRSRLTREGALDRIRSRIRNEKTLDFLYRRSA